MKRMFLCLILILSSVLAFQNCGQPLLAELENTETEENTQDTSSIEAPVVKKVLLVPLVSSQNTSWNLTEISVSWEDQVVTGVLVEAANPGNQVTQSKKISAEDIEAFQHIFAEYSLCFKKPEPPGIVCTMAYTEPYAQLIDPTTGRTIRLGSIAQCGNGEADFCVPEKRDSLNQLLNKILADFFTLEDI